MHRYPYMKIFVVLALVISLIMNFSLSSKMNQLENQIQSISTAQHDILNKVRGQRSHIESVLNDFKEEQSWISAINMDVNTEDMVKGQGEVTFNWQVKELDKDSEVVFNYSYGGGEDYTTIPAEELQQGLFQVEVPVEIRVEPQWEVGYINPDSKMQRMNNQKPEQDMFKYFVSVSTGDKVKSGDIQTEYLGDIGTSYYGFLNTNIHMREKDFRVTIRNHSINQSSIMVKEVYLLKYENETLLEEEEIKLVEENHPPDNTVRLFILDNVERYDNMRLAIKVVYNNGKTFEKEIY